MVTHISSTTTIKRALLIIAAIIVGAFFFPFDRTVVPQWRFQVVSEAGHPIANTPVRQIWQHYSVEDADHEEDSITDQNGFAEFPRRRIRVSQFQIIRGSILNFTQYSIHASYGPSSFIIVLAGEEYINDGYYKKGWKLPSRIVVRPLHPIKK
jgi:hypothetical protein